MNGVLIIDKPAGFTSFDVVAVARKLTGEKKIGHTGTLDPMATGVLPLLLGRAAKAADLLEDTSKTYRAGFRLGTKTDTGDITGTAIRKAHAAVKRADLEAALQYFRGEIMQVPPMYSAVSVDGKRLYKLARQGIEVERKARPVFVGRLELLCFDTEKQEGTLTVSCSKGTYIRTLIEDISESLGTYGTMVSLRRTQACGFTELDAVTLEEIKTLAEKNRLAEKIRPADCLFESLPALQITAAQTIRFQNGGSLAADRLRMPEPLSEGRRYRIYSPENIFLGLASADAEAGELKMLKLFFINTVLK